MVRMRLLARALNGHVRGGYGNVQVGLVTDLLPTL